MHDNCGVMIRKTLLVVGLQITARLIDECENGRLETSWIMAAKPVGNNILHTAIMNRAGSLPPRCDAGWTKDNVLCQQDIVIIHSKKTLGSNTHIHYAITAVCS